jgi:hypothetical protein
MLPMATKTQRQRESLSEKTVTKKFADDVVVNAGELAEALRTSRWTVGRWRERGYRFLYGKYTTPAHAKNWLKDQAKKASAPAPSAQDDERLAAAMNRLNQ